jgi:dTDP-4-amino-4,6-dideoxygalactose transaminase
MHFLLFNPSHPDDVGEPIEDDEVKEALRDGYLVDPESGKEIRDFEKLLAPYFVPSSALKAK